MELLFAAATSLAQAHVPLVIFQALISARLTALSKSDGGVRGIATGHIPEIGRTCIGQAVYEARTVPVRTVNTSRQGTSSVQQPMQIPKLPRSTRGSWTGSHGGAGRTG